MPINCNEISQNINLLTNAFDQCHKIDPKDLKLLVELVAAIYNCSEQGTKYDTLVQQVFTPVADQVVTYPIDNYHAISVLVIEGKITQNINGTIVTYPTGTVLNHEVTTLNQTPFTFTAKAGSKVTVERLIETI